ncbi:MAG: hypothetical protein Q7T03_02255 [Deltaproteobacteria bacterium]|nr:hypothetical protein [Deltaproteobacteria bacterium]
MNDSFKFPAWKVPELDEERQSALLGRAFGKFHKKRLRKKQLVRGGVVFAAMMALVFLIGRPSLEQEVLAARFMLMEEITNSTGNVSMAQNETDILGEEGHYEKIWSYGDRCLSHCIH